MIAQARPAVAVSYNDSSTAALSKIHTRQPPAAVIARTNCPPYTFGLMGFADRQYARRDYGRPTAVGAMRLWSVTTWLIAINVAVFLANWLTFSDDTPRGWLYEWGYFSAATVIYHLEFWRLITFQFLHSGFQHILFNMISLYFFGPIVENYLGGRRYLGFYLLCGIAGAMMYLAMWAVGLLHYGSQTALVGASAGIFGVLIAGAKVAPDTTVMLVFPPIPLRLRVVALITLGIAVWVVFSYGDNAGGESAHLGGAAMGALLIWRPELLNVFDFWPRRRRKKRFFMDR
jgi:membrane associated rhomboid family serine protease